MSTAAERRRRETTGFPDDWANGQTMLALDLPLAAMDALVALVRATDTPDAFDMGTTWARTHMLHETSQWQFRPAYMAALQRIPHARVTELGLAAIHMHENRERNTTANPVAPDHQIMYFWSRHDKAGAWYDITASNDPPRTADNPVYPRPRPGRFWLKEPVDRVLAHFINTCRYCVNRLAEEAFFRHMCPRCQMAHYCSAACLAADKPAHPPGGEECVFLAGRAVPLLQCTTTGIPLETQTPYLKLIRDAGGWNDGMPQRIRTTLTNAQQSCTSFAQMPIIAFDQLVRIIRSLDTPDACVFPRGAWIRGVQGAAAQGAAAQGAAAQGAAAQGAAAQGGWTATPLLTTRLQHWLRVHANAAGAWPHLVEFVAGIFRKRARNLVHHPMHAAESAVLFYNGAQMAWFDVTASNDPAPRLPTMARPVPRRGFFWLDTPEDNPARYASACRYCCNRAPAPARYSKCGRCYEARYCSRECQRADWPVHVHECARFAGDDASSVEEDNTGLHVDGYHV